MGWGENVHCNDCGKRFDDQGRWACLPDEARGAIYVCDPCMRQRAADTRQAQKDAAMFKDVPTKTRGW